jgi:HlyD family secretion protein
MGDGYRVEARPVLWQADDVLKAPQGAVFRHGDRWATYRVSGGIAPLAPVEVGHRGDTEVEILSGLSPGPRRGALEECHLGLLRARIPGLRP